MSALSSLKELFSNLHIPVETGVFSGVPPDEYLVLTPLLDQFELFTDDFPTYEIQEVRISLFTKNNYIQRKNQLVRLLLQADFTITEKRYIEHENDTGFHHYSIDVAKQIDINDLI